MSLQDLNENLHRRSPQSRTPQSESNPFDPRFHQDRPQQEKQNIPAEWAGTGTGMPSPPYSDKKMLRVGGWLLGGIALLVLGVGAFVKIQQSLFHPDKVTVTLAGPDKVGGSLLTTYAITYANANRTALKNARLELSYPENFRPEGNATHSAARSEILIGEIAPHSEGKIDFTGKFYGSRGSLAYVKAVLRYVPDKVTSEFETESQIGVTIQSSSLHLEVGAPLEVASGGLVEYALRWTNLGDTALSNIRLKAEYPDGFHFREADRKPSEGETIWYIGEVAPGETGRIRISGTLGGVRDEAKTVKMRLGILQGNGELLSYSEEERLTKIVASPLIIAQTANGLTALTVRPGETLNYSIKYHNAGTIGLRNTIITLEIQSSILDYSRLQLEKGAFDSGRQMIVWKASDIPDLVNLPPGATGEIRFSVPVLENIPLRGENDRNFTVSTLAKIDSPDIPDPEGANKIIGSNLLALKLNAQPKLISQGFYYDKQLPNTGPLPPAVGQETSYTLRWSVTNTTNDISETTVTATLPTGVKWLGTLDPPDENVTFNTRTNQIAWNIGKLPSGTGFWQPSRSVAFRVSVTPETAAVGNTATLLSGTALIAKDLFTGQALQSKTDPKTTALPEDADIPGTAYRIVQ